MNACCLSVSLKKEKSWYRWYKGCLEIFSAVDTARHRLHLFTHWNSSLVLFLFFRSSQLCYEWEEVCHNSTKDRTDCFAILLRINLLGKMNHYPSIDCRNPSQQNNKKKNLSLLLLQFQEMVLGTWKTRKIYLNKSMCYICSKILA